MSTKCFTGKELQCGFSSNQLLTGFEEHGFKYIITDSRGEPSLLKLKVENWQSRSSAESLQCDAKSEGLAEALEERFGRGQLQLVGSEVTSRCPSQLPNAGLLLFCRSSHFKLPNFSHTQLGSPQEKKEEKYKK